MPAIHSIQASPAGAGRALHGAGARPVRYVRRTAQGPPARAPADPPDGAHRDTKAPAEPVDSTGFPVRSCLWIPTGWERALNVFSFRVQSCYRKTQRNLNQKPPECKSNLTARERRPCAWQREYGNSGLPSYYRDTTAPECAANCVQYITYHLAPKTTN